uniref:Uncharacterized protein n=1 Tax=Pavo cristatus TaxID=9049 RepID=A0A8C9FEK3_PAVCR
MELGSSFSPPCYRTVQIRTQWSGKTKIQLMATEVRMGKNDSFFLTSSFLDEYLVRLISPLLSVT